LDAFIREKLEALYFQYNRPTFIQPDPLQFLHEYEEIRDREIVGFVASALAYGRVAQILRSVSTVLERMGPSPQGYLLESTHAALRKTFRGFKHRFTTGEELATTLFCIKRIIERHGSLNACFVSHLHDGDENVLRALCEFVGELVCIDNGQFNSLMPSPKRGSACKRLNLFLRWVVRSDAVDPGGWHSVPAHGLIVPMDTHMHRIALCMGLTRRKQPDMQAALEMTAGFRRLAPDDPIRYDFSLTRLGIRKDGDLMGFMRECGLGG
jgi:uncharacterized protein (TIGR02757 family)